MKRPLTPRELRIVIESIHLKRFKNFQDATLKLGPLTILIGANAAGKSNLRDAFLFLHGIGRGYTLAEIFGEKYVGGERVWSGTRGGVREVAYLGSDSFELVVALRLPPESSASPVEYRIEVSVAEPLAEAPHVVHESLHYPHLFGKSMHAKGETGFQTEAQEKRGAEDLTVSFFPKRGTTRKSSSKTYPPKVPILFQVSEDTEGNGREARALSRSVLHELRDFWFLDLSPTQMRIPSPPGQTALGDQGENLSSVLAAICADASWKQVLLEWVRKLTPMDVDDLSIRSRCRRSTAPEIGGKGRAERLGFECIGWHTPVPCNPCVAVRPRACVAVLHRGDRERHSPDAARSPGRSHRASNQTARNSDRGYQPFATALAGAVRGILKNCSLVYRLPDHPDAKIKPILEIPNARRVIDEQPVWVLHASSWFEDVMNLTEDVGPQPMDGNQPAP